MYLSDKVLPGVKAVGKNVKVTRHGHNKLHFDYTRSDCKFRLVITGYSRSGICYFMFELSLVEES